MVDWSIQWQRDELISPPRQDRWRLYQCLAVVLKGGFGLAMARLEEAGRVLEHLKMKREAGLGGLLSGAHQEDFVVQKPC